MATYRDVVFRLAVVMATTITAVTSVSLTRVASESSLVLHPSHSNSLDDVTYFVRRWFYTYRSPVPDTRQPEVDRLTSSRTKRDTVVDKTAPEIKINSTNSNETSFEVYEKVWVENRTLNYIKQIYFYTKYRDENNHSQQSSTTSGYPQTTAAPPSNTTDSGRTDPVYEEMLERVTNASLTQLLDALKDVKETAERGAEDTGIASLCCPLG